MALLYVLKGISGCGLSFPCPNPSQLVRLGILLCEHLSAGCLRKLKCQIDLLRFYFLKEEGFYTIHVMNQSKGMHFSAAVK